MSSGPPQEAKDQTFPLLNLKPRNNHNSFRSVGRKNDGCFAAAFGDSTVSKRVLYKPPSNQQLDVSKLLELLA